MTGNGRWEIEIALHRWRIVCGRWTADAHEPFPISYFPFPPLRCALRPHQRLHLRTVALGAAVIGIVAGALGCFAVLRRQSLVGDAMSHAALPGIAVAYMLTGSKDNLVLLIGAAIAGWLATLAVMAIVRTSRVKFDSALGLVLSVFFGFGLMLLTFIQREPDASQAGLDKFLFGQAATLIEDDVETMAVLGSIAIGVMLLWKEFKLLAFDQDFAATIGYPVRGLDVLLTTLIVIAIVVGLQAVGVVLMSAAIVAPAAGARQWTNRLGVMVLLAAIFGAAAESPAQPSAAPPSACQPAPPSSSASAPSSSFPSLRPQPRARLGLVRSPQTPREELRRAMAEADAAHGGLRVIGNGNGK